MTSTVSDALAGLRRQFTDQLSTRLQTIRDQFRRLDPAAWRVEDLEAVHRLVHGLTGSAGTFGMQSVSDVARVLEVRLAALLKTGIPPDAAAWTAIAADMDRLYELARIRLEANAPSLKPPAAPARLDRSPLIHLVEDDPAQADHLSQALREDGYRVSVFAEPAAFRAAHAAAGAERPAAVVMDMILPGGKTAGADLVAELGLGRNTGIPVVIASVRDDLPARLAAFRAGASRYLAKPLQAGSLIDLLDTLTGRQPPQPYRVLLVDDDPLLLDVHAAVLRAAGMEVRTLSQPLQILALLQDFAPDVAILDVYMPDASGPELAAVLRERDAQLHIPILFLSAETDMTQQLLALNLGGDDFLVKPVQPDHLVAAVTARARRARQNSAVRQRLETTLYEREREHLALDQHAIVSIADRAGNITYVNDRFCAVSGYSRAELLGANHRIVKSGAHPPAFYKELWQTVARGDVWHGEICNRRKDGSPYWVESTITPFLDDIGKPYQYVSIRTDITVQRQAEQALEVDRERLRRGQIYANIGTWEWDIQKGDLYWSERIAPLFGYPAGDLQTSYDNFLAALHPDDRQAVIDAVGACIEHDVPYEIEHRVVWPDGTVRWLLERGAVLRDADGKPLQMLGVVQDIDERKRAELALSERERQLREAQSLAHIGNWMADLATGALTWSDEIYRIFGHEPGEFAPSVAAFAAAVHPDDRALLAENEKRAAQTGRLDVVHRIQRQDGIIRHVHELAQAETDAKGNVIRLTGTVQDVTERVEAEHQLRESERRLKKLAWEQGKRAKESKCLTAVIQGLLDERHSDDAALEAAVRLIPAGWQEPGDTCVRIRFGDKVFATPGFTETEWQQSAAIPLMQEGTHDITVCRLGPPEIGSGQNLFLPEEHYLLLNIAGQIGQAMARQSDQRALVAARDEADRANQAKSEFLSSMSHELRTPMNAILGFGQLLECDYSLPEEHRDNAREILKAGRHLLNLINEVLDLAKVESGFIDLSLEPVEVYPIVEECRSLIAPLAIQREITFGHSVAQGVAVRADRTRLKQILLNLLSNAINYNRPGGSVRVELERRDNRLRIRVTDTGIGIPAERLAELFQPFNRLDAEGGSIEGTGIGLTITRRIVEIMGGEVDVASEVGVGSTFWVELPLDFIAERNQAGRGPDSAAPEQFAEAQPRTVLHIEDNPSNLKLVAQILGRRPSIHLLTAHTADLGIELALARQPDLILLDINMPGMDGYRLLEIFRAEARLKDIPVVALTANAMPRDIERGAAAGFTDYLTKPIDVTKFLATLERCLRHRPESGV